MAAIAAQAEIQLLQPHGLIRAGIPPLRVQRAALSAT
jgi:hypothetical protein